MTQRSRRPRSTPRRVLAGATLVTSMLIPATAASAETTTRLSGGTNVDVALAYSQATFADGAAPVVLLARDDDFADALTSNSVQGKLNAPLLLTNSQVLSPMVMAEIERLGAEEAVIMGGSAAVSDTVETELGAMGLETSRFDGADRVDTALIVAATLFPDATSAVVARAFPDSDITRAFADPIAAGAYAAAAEVPVLLTMTDALPAPVQAYVEDSFIEDAIVAGGTLAVSDAVVAELEAIDIADLAVTDETGASYDFTTRRVAGQTRGGTATAFAAELGYATAADAPRVLLVESYDGDAWAAGLTLGAQAGNGAAVLFANRTALFGETTTFLGEGANVPLLCGPRVDVAACDAASTALGNEG